MISTDILEAKWMQLRGKIKEQWGKLTDNDLDRVGGKRDQLVGLIQAKYGYTKDQAHQQLEQFLKEMNIH